MKTFFKILLYIIGFPALIALVVLESMPVIKNGATYAPYVYGGVIIAAVLALLYFITALITWLVSRKAKTKKALRTCSIILVLVGFIFTSGIFIIVDQVLPDILDDATDGTIAFEDVRDDYVARSDFHALLLERFITMNVNNGNLAEFSLEEYLEQGWKNEEVKELISISYESINEGYGSFVGPWIDLANDDRMTIPVVVHLVLNERAVSTKPFMFLGEGRAEEGRENEPITWSIMEMQSGVLSLDLSGLLGGEEIKSILEEQFVADILDNWLDPIIAALNEAIADPALANTYITVGLDLNSGEVSITPTSEDRGVWDYMHQAWFNSNEMLFLVISLFPARKILLIFGGWIVILSFIIAMIRERQYGKNLVKLNKKDAGNDIGYNAPLATSREEDENLSPYLKATQTAMEELYRRRGI